MTISLPNPAQPPTAHAASHPKRPLPQPHRGNGFRRGRQICAAALAAAGLLVSASCSGGAENVETADPVAAASSGDAPDTAEPRALAMSDDLFAPIDESTADESTIDESTVGESTADESTVDEGAATVALLATPAPDAGASTLRELRQARSGGSAVADSAPQPAPVADQPPPTGAVPPVDGSAAVDEAANPALAGLAADEASRAAAADTAAPDNPAPDNPAPTTTGRTPAATPTPVPVPTAPAATPTPEPTPTPPADPSTDPGPVAGSDTGPVVGPSAGSVDFSNQSLIDTIYLDEDIDGADFSGSDLTLSVFAELSMTGTNFTDAILVNAFFDQVDLSGANFTNADLSEVIAYDSTMANVTYGNTTCPDGVNSDDVGGTCDGHWID